MSSVPRSSRGINSNVQFFVALGAVDGVTVDNVNAEIAALSAAGDLLGNLGSVINVNGLFTPNTTLNAAASGDLLRDMGKTLYVQDNNVNVEIYKLVQLVNGPNGDVFYALVWAANGNGVQLVRTGY